MLSSIAIFMSVLTFFYCVNAQEDKISKSYSSGLSFANSVAAKSNNSTNFKIQPKMPDIKDDAANHKGGESARLIEERIKSASYQTTNLNLPDFKENTSYKKGVELSQSLSNKISSVGEQNKPCCQAEKFYKQKISEFKNPLMLDNNSEKILIFVSFSMPEASLKALAASMSSTSYQSTFIIRGLIDDSFKKTALKIKELNTEMEVNPVDFEEYNVTKVPTFILVRKGKEVSRLSGNVTLDFALEKLREES